MRITEVLQHSQEFTDDTTDFRHRMELLLVLASMSEASKL